MEEASRLYWHLAPHREEESTLILRLPNYPADFTRNCLMIIQIYVPCSQRLLVSKTPRLSPRMVSRPVKHSNRHLNTIYIFRPKPVTRLEILGTVWGYWKIVYTCTFPTRALGIWRFQLGATILHGHQILQTLQTDAKVFKSLGSHHARQKASIRTRTLSPQGSKKKERRKWRISKRKTKADQTGLGVWE